MAEIWSSKTVEDDRKVAVLNAVVTQKNLIMSMINGADDYDVLMQAYSLIQFAAPLWSALMYGYKTGELRVQLRVRAEQLIANAQEYLAGCRKNCKTANTTRAEIAKLQQLCELCA